MIRLLLVLLALGACSKPKPVPPPPGSPAEKILRTIEPLRALFPKMGPVRPGDWLETHPEAGQTFAEYLASDPRRPIGKRSVIYIQPVGDFSKAQAEILKLTVEFIGVYFGCPVKVREALPQSRIPESATRVHPSWGMKQILTTYVMSDVLVQNRPDDAAAVLGLCATDLWPGEGWNFVFGQADLLNGVGVWSMYRNGNPDESPESYALYLRRSVKTATHEIGHIFGIHHCTAAECNMNGSNNREESDRHPLELCPECFAKSCWAAETAPTEICKRVLAFCEANRLTVEAARYKQLLEKLTS